MGLFDFVTKTSAQRQAKKEAKEQAKWLRREEELMNSDYAKDIDRRFAAVMAGENMERKEGKDFCVWEPKGSESVNGGLGKQEGKDADGAAAAGTSKEREKSGEK